MKPSPAELEHGDWDFGALKGDSCSVCEIRTLSLISSLSEGPTVFCLIKQTILKKMS